MNEAKSSASQPYWEDFKCSIRYIAADVDVDRDSESMSMDILTNEKQDLVLWKNNLWINNYCGNKLLSAMTDVMHPFVADKRSPLCEPWAFDEQQSMTKSTSKKGTVTCVAQRPFSTRKSSLKLNDGDFLRWRVGFNSWKKADDAVTVASGFSKEMTMKVALQKTEPLII